MDWTVEEISHAFSGRLVGKLPMRAIVCETVLLLPSDMIQYVTGNVWFISSPEDAWAFTFRGADIKERHLVILSEELFEQDKKQIQYTILHEIGHVILQHKNSIGYEQTQSEIDQQELQADIFAKKYLNQSS